MSAPDEPLGPLKRKDGDPVFDEPWQAQALAMADSLVQEGTLSASDWAATLGAEIRSATNAGAPDNATQSGTASPLSQLFLPGREFDWLTVRRIEIRLFPVFPPYLVTVDGCRMSASG